MQRAFLALKRMGSRMLKLGARFLQLEKTMDSYLASRIRHRTKPIHCERRWAPHVLAFPISGRNLARIEAEITASKAQPSIVRFKTARWDEGETWEEIVIPGTLKQGGGL